MNKREIVEQLQTIDDLLENDRQNEAETMLTELRIQLDREDVLMFDTVTRIKKSLDWLELHDWRERDEIVEMDLLIALRKDLRELGVL